ncbi:hypothetical protein FISHEDRAFT_56092 [Fistulina hepatica ATCC 64428]|uniref:Uncharacterized protein n=1 Tax=Fistulina hepatica ATCC 64428 TaxID=1128425 RepID=A0A0D7ALD0_9AGAR|nr:hypothetical protein FISHEDRAFT_56092 [Fistulina hepatica ATCC 64428]
MQDSARDDVAPAFSYEGPLTRGRLQAAQRDGQLLDFCFPTYVEPPQPQQCAQVLRPPTAPDLADSYARTRDDAFIVDTLPGAEEVDYEPDFVHLEGIQAQYGQSGARREATSHARKAAANAPKTPPHQAKSRSLRGAPSTLLTAPSLLKATPAPTPPISPQSAALCGAPSGAPSTLAELAAAGTSSCPPSSSIRADILTLLDAQGLTGHARQAARSRMMRKAKRQQRAAEKPTELRTVRDVDPQQLAVDCAAAKLFVSKAHDLPITSTGWQGLDRSQYAAVRDLRDKWRSGELTSISQKLYKVPFHDDHSKQLPTCITDALGRLVIVRSSIADWMEQLIPQINEDHAAFVADCEKPTADAARMSNLRGPHFSSVMGHDRNNKTLPALTGWHKSNEGAIDKLMSKRTFKRYNGMANALLETYFPGIAARCKVNRDYVKKKYGIQPMYGNYWNFCINAALPNKGVYLVDCEPHADAKNVAIMMCILFIYGLFNDKERCWLCIWDFGFVIQIPAGCFLLFPSALFLHYNVDIIAVSLSPKTYTPWSRGIPLQEQSCDSGRNETRSFSPPSSDVDAVEAFVVLFPAVSLLLKDPITPVTVIVVSSKGKGEEEVVEGVGTNGKGGAMAVYEDASVEGVPSRGVVPVTLAQSAASFNCLLLGVWMPFSGGHMCLLAELVISSVA